VADNRRQPTDRSRRTKIAPVEAIPLETPQQKVFSGSFNRVTGRNTIVTRIRTAGGLASAVYNGDNRTHGREIARIVAVLG
jgi:D-galactarolactone cycloisomerase